jgi:hypothetical protein
MRFLLCFGILLATGCCAFADKKVVSPVTSAGNDQVDIVATISLDEKEVARKIGMDAGAGIVLLEVKFTPKTDKPVQVSPDDFILLAHDDGERSKPFEPEQLAGQGALVVNNKADGTKIKKTGSSFGLGGMMGGAGGSPGNSRPTVLDSHMDDKKKGDNSLVQALKAKQLPETEAKNEVTGYLYFPLDGKHKLKNLAVLYRGQAGRLDLEFEH